MFYLLLKILGQSIANHEVTYNHHYVNKGNYFECISFKYILKNECILNLS